MNIIQFEKIIIKLLFVNKTVREKVFPFLTDKIFDNDEHKQIIFKILDFYNNQNNFPSLADMKVGLESEKILNCLLEIMNEDISEYTEDYLFEKIEEFFKGKLIHNKNMDIGVALADNKLGNIQNYVDEMRDVLAFNFDDRVGLDFLEDTDVIFKSFSEKDKTISTGINTLDRLLDGGFHEKTIVLFMAGTGKGKSAVIASLATSCLLNNKNTLILSLEMSEKKYAHRIAGNLYDTEVLKLKNLLEADFKLKSEGFRKMVKSKLIIKDYPTKSKNVNHIRNLLSELRTKKKFVPDIIFLDYLELLKTTNMTKNDNSFSELKKVTEEVRGLASEYGFPIVSAVQVNRDALDSPTIDMEDISQSIGIAYTADVIIGITQPPAFKEINKYLWRIAKNRDGIAENRRVTMNMDFKKMKVTEDEEANKKMEMSKVAEAVEEVGKNLKKNDELTVKRNYGNWE